ncbi:MAG: hypothetical protein E6I97_18390 [Chloroflexi bacterium]|nr:MAG: hypothetical protein E6I97_18390 [Chloroflexota bacterium]
MAKHKFGLGRGLDALMPGASDVIPAQQPSRIDENAILFAAIDSIIPNPRQPRRIFREDDPKLLELSYSIKEHGLLQPLVVTRLDTYGELEREKGVDPWLEGREGRDRSTITNSIRLLQLTPKVRDALINQQEHFSEGHARALIGITREEDQITAMGKIIALKLNVRQAEELSARIKAVERADMENHAPSSIHARRAELDDLEARFRSSLMVKVDLRCNTKGKGTLVLHFNNQDELERLYSRLVSPEE